MTIRTSLSNVHVQRVLIILITFLCFGNIILNDYALDDRYTVENKYVQKGLDGLYDIWTHPYLELEGMNIDYRPLSLTFQSIEFMLFDSSPTARHIISILLYVIAVLLLFRICITIFRLDKINPYLPFIITLIYVVHPAHTEVVASIKNQDEIISFIFILLAAQFFDKSFSKSNTIINLILTLFFVYLSMLTKMVSLPFLATLFLWTLYNKKYKNYKIFLSLLISIIGIIVIQLVSFKDFYFQRVINYSENPIGPDTLLSYRLGLGFNSLFYYLKFMFIPYPFRFYYGYDVIPFESIINPMPLISLLIYIVILILFLYSIIKQKSYSFFLSSFIFCLLFYSNLFTRYIGIVSERSMFQFSFFFIAFVILFIYDLSLKYSKIIHKYKVIIQSFCFIYFFIFFGLTIKRNSEWKDSYKLILQDMQYLGNSALGNHIAAQNFYMKSMQLKKSDTTVSRQWAELAVYYYNASISIYPDTRKIYYDLGNTYKYGLRNLDLAEKNYMIAISKSPPVRDAYRELASIYFTKEEFNKAVPYYVNALKKEPNDSILMFYAALNLYNSKNISQFLQLNSELLQRFPNEQYAYLNYGTYYFNLNMTDSIVVNFEKAVKFGCENRQVIDYLHRYYSEKKEKSKTEFYQKLLLTN